MDGRVVDAGWLNGGWVGWKGGWVDGRVVGWIGGWMDG